MIMHIFGLRWKPEASPEQKERALAKVRGFAASIPGVLELLAGTNLSPHSGGYETVGVMRFADKNALQTYLEHPVHQEFVAWVAPLVEAVDLDLDLDLEA